jgi:Domain of unknown function (DUF4266)
VLQFTSKQDRMTYDRGSIKNQPLDKMNIRNAMKSLTTYPFRLIAPIVIIFGLAGCTHAKTWELQNLAKPEMSLDYTTLEKRIPEHLDRSRETSASVSVDNNGCSCY